MLTPQRINKARLSSGLVLFTYVTIHLINHSLGLISVAAMQAMLDVVENIWESIPGTIVLYGAFLLHIALALFALYRRRALRMPGPEAAQLCLGFLIPFLLAQHLAATRLLYSLYDGDDTYRAELLRLYTLAPSRGMLQLILLVAAWIHGSIGLNYSLRLRSWYPTLKPLLFAVAVLIPILAILGFVEGGREIAELARDPDWLSRQLAHHAITPQAQAHLDRLRDWMRGTMTVLILLVLALRLIRRQWERRRGTFRVTYPDGRRIEALNGMSVLEVSRLARIPHASVCGGRGRCSTCRIRVVGPASALPDLSDAEMKVLHRLSAPPNVRLACQLRPTGDIAATPLLPPTIAASDKLVRSTHMTGSEREIAILFADIRAFTELAEHKLPYDVVFLLNRYFEEMGRAIEGAGGQVDKFIGDGIMALFGVESSIEEGCRAALAAAAAMSERLVHLNQMLSADLARPLRIGIGIHAGPTIIGEMGFGRTVSVTAIGDAVNTASRLEAMTKEAGVELIVSEIVARHAATDLDRFPALEIMVRGRAQPLTIRSIPLGSDLAQ
ncbi:adenylate/guanylate cyclase domain-containing protein [Aliidongia dinghuensis]|uniref:Adenylate/guanylate cyclase domain-containing protein n=1 Tax=Aliidongia dinghuensis TaxID=1867774 RepID=A0A8J2YU34_9PROT|nr:adenylate/guanylate cyclase domain-containing protein [Aliidongia dinghuensis]GGF22124.1 adenylate/guanylate cyclase domain-containing protein [Aliidongia dinghuensis]